MKIYTDAEQIIPTRRAYLAISTQLNVLCVILTV